MFAAAAGLGVTDSLVRAVDAQHAIAGKNGQAGAVRNPELQAVQRDDGAGLCAVREIEDPLFELAAEDGLDAEAAQVFGVHRRVEAVAAETRGGIQQLDTADDFDSQTSGGVHGQPEGDYVRFPNG